MHIFGGFPGRNLMIDVDNHQPMGNLMVSSDISHANVTRIGRHLWQIDSDLPLGYLQGGFSLEPARHLLGPLRTPLDLLQRLLAKT